MLEHKCTDDCRCPNCDETMAAVARMDPDQYAEWNQRMTAALLARAPSGNRTEMRQLHGTEFRAVAAPAAAPAAPARRTPIEEVRRGIERVRRQVQREQIRDRRFSDPVRRRIANETAAAHRAAVASTIPNPYDVPAEQRRQRDERREANR